jgi:hypothetical protein
VVYVPMFQRNTFANLFCPCRNVGHHLPDFVVSWFRC